jgi:putative membrane protein
MLILGMIAAFLAAALHVFVFYIESFAWTTRALSVFGIDRESAEVTKEMAFNQGFYNLFLAIEVFVGIAVYFLASPTVGLTLALFGVGSMLAAALLLFVTSPTSVPPRSSRVSCPSSLSQPSESLPSSEKSHAILRRSLCGHV